MANIYKKYSDRLHQSQRHDVRPGRILSISPSGVKVFVPRSPLSDNIATFAWLNGEYAVGDLIDIRFCLGSYSNLGISPAWVQEQFEKEFPAEELAEG